MENIGRLIILERKINVSSQERNDEKLLKGVNQINIELIIAFDGISAE